MLSPLQYQTRIFTSSNTLTPHLFLFHYYTPLSPPKQLGEHTEYAKQTNFDLATHVPLLIRDPTKADTSAGQHASKTKAELVDLYRTLVALSGLPVADIETDVDGIDLSTVLDDPSLTLREYAFSQYARYELSLESSTSSNFAHSFSHLTMMFFVIFLDVREMLIGNIQCMDIQTGI